MKQINTDFQGWPIYALTLEDILTNLKVKKTDEGWFISKDNPYLDKYPRVLEDDGMGYGINLKYISEASFGYSEETGPYINVFIDKETND